MKILNTTQLKKEKILRLLRESRSKAEDVKTVVAKILNEVKEGKDAALFALTERLDKVKLRTLAVSTEEIRGAYELLNPAVISALKKAKSNIEKFHKAAVQQKEQAVETVSGVKVWREFRPIEKVGLYVPGGQAAYPSTVLMLALPAKIAGCKEIIMCSPPLKDGTINPAVLVAADLCGIKNIFKIGGAQAIAAMAYGTETVTNVSKIFGPGNQFVTTAKMLVYGEVNIDMPAGPSEIAIIADDNANPAWIAADLLSQLEHGRDSQALLVTFSENMARAVIQQMNEQIGSLSRSAIIEESYKKSFAVVVRSIEEACKITNEYAPEHLEIIAEAESEILKKINNVGSVFLGKYSSEPLGDYATGANHTLPTSGFAKMFPPLSTDSFSKMIQIQKVSQKGIGNLRKTVETLATAEDLDAHKNAVTIRFL